MTIRVVVVDDQELVRSGFRMILKPNPTSRSSAKQPTEPRHYSPAGRHAQMSFSWTSACRGWTVFRPPSS